MIWRPCGVGRSNPTVDKLFLVMFTCSVFLAAGHQKGTVGYLVKLSWELKLDNAKRGIPSQVGNIDLDL